MSILSISKTSSIGNMGTPSFHELKKQASFFFKEKIKSARLALADVTPAQLLTEEATSGNPWAPDGRTLGSISRAAFEVDDYWRIVDILHNRFLRFDRKNWRASYNSLAVLEHLLTHGPESAAAEFQIDKDAIREIGSFQFIDEKGFNWGQAVRTKSERILNLLDNGVLLRKERDRARKLKREIQGFGSFSQRSSSAQSILQESSNGTFARSNSEFVSFNKNQSTKENCMETSQKGREEDCLEVGKKERKVSASDSNGNDWMFEKPQTSFKENMGEEMHRWNHSGEAKPLLGGRREAPRIGEKSHPFSDTTENQTKQSLLSAREGIIQGC